MGNSSPTMENMEEKLDSCHKSLIKEYEDAKAKALRQLQTTSDYNEWSYQNGRRESALHALTQFELRFIKDEERAINGLRGKYD